MKKLLKILGIVTAALVVFVILLFVAAKVKEKDIADLALKKVSKSIKAPITIEDISLNLIRRFPLATVELKGICLGSPDALNLPDSNIPQKDTLATINRLFISAKSKPLFKGEFEIMRVDVRGVNLNYIVNSKGISNFDFLMDTTQTESSDTTAISLNVMLKELMLRDIHCNYYDSLNLISARAVIPRTRINGEIQNEFMQGTAKGILKLSDCSYKSTNLRLMKETRLDFDVAYSGDSVDIKDLIIITDGADFKVSGNAVIKDTLETDLNFQGAQINLDELIKYVPEKMFKEYGVKKVSGKISFDGTVKGPVADSVLPEVKMNFELKRGYAETADYPAVKNISMTAFLTNGRLRNNKSTSVSIKGFHAETDQSSFDLSGTLNDLDHIQYSLSSDLAIELGEFRKFIPDTLVQDVSGRVIARFVTSGVLPDSVTSDFVDYMLNRSQVHMTLKNLYLAVDSSLSVDSLSGQLTYDLHHLTVSNLNVNVPSYKVKLINTSFDAGITGKLTEPTKMGINLNSFQVRTGMSAFYGTAKIYNPEAPEFNINANIRLNLSEIKDMLPDSLINNMSGEITAQFDSHGKIDPDSIADQINDLVFNNSSFLINFNKVRLDMPDTLMCVKALSGQLVMKPDTIDIFNIRGMYAGTDFGLDSTKIVNLYHSVIKGTGSQVQVYAQLRLGDLDYRMFAPFVADYMDTTSTSEEIKDTAEIAENTDTTASGFTFSVKGKLFIRSMTYKKARVEDISALYNLSDSLYLVDQLKFRGFGGLASTSVMYKIQKDHEKTLCVKNILTNMNISRLLRDFDNFEEFYKPELTYDNISGILSSEFDTQMLYRNDSIVRDKLYVRGTIKLEKGGIYNYQPVKDQEGNLKAINNLDTLEFKTINTSIFVLQDTVWVPSTLIYSNKLDATALGLQCFAGDYSYHLIVYIGEILSGNTNRNEKKNAEGEEVISKGRKGTRVKSFKLNGKSGSGLDNKKDQLKMKITVEAANRLLKLRFNPNITSYETGVK